MASYDALINLKVKGLNKLKKVEKSVNRINNFGKKSRGSTSTDTVLAAKLKKQKLITNELREQLKVSNKIVKSNKKERETKPRTSSTRRRDRSISQNMGIPRGCLLYTSPSPRD